MITKWQITKLSDDDELKARDLALGLNLSLVTGRLLVQRGIRYLNKAKQYLKPNLRQLNNPFLLKDMDKAVERLNRAIEQKEHILIYGDSDVDGTTAVALVYNVFRDYFLPEDYLHYLIPDSSDEGHGMSIRAVDLAKEKGASLLIALDCGTKAHQEIAYAKSLGIDCIVCDHHQTDETLPPALALLNPKRADDTYPNNNLSGCGVGFKMMQALAYSRHIALPHIKQYLELVAISTIVDLVPITGENRVMVALGLNQLNQRPSLGLRYLIQNIGLNGKTIDSYDIMYKIGPRLNASGRMYQGAETVALLTAIDHQTAYSSTTKLEELNNKRRTLDKKITKQAIGQANQLKDIEHCKSLILYRSDWHHGILGIVASRLNERYNRPTLIISKRCDFLVGSARSMPNIDLYGAFEDLGDILDSFGGHRQAVGFSLQEHRLEEFIQRITDYFEHYSEGEELCNEINVDAILDIDDINKQLIKEINMLAPFGLDNREPVFASYKLQDAGNSQVVGKQQQHLKLHLKKDEASKHSVKGIGLGLGRLGALLDKESALNICYTIAENDYFAEKFIELRVKDLNVD